MNRKDLKIFLVEFGNPEIGGYSYYSGNNIKPVTVIAGTYEEAGQKAMYHVEQSTSSPVVGYDGSLSIPIDEIKIKAIKLLCDDIAW